MASRGLLNLGLVVLALLIGLVIYFEPGLEPEATPQPLTSLLAPRDATTIHIERRQYAPLSFIKRHGRWYLLTEKQELPASTFQLQALLRLLETSSSSHYAADSVDLKSLGLDPPQASMTIDGVKFLFGNTAPLGGERYVQTGTTVYLIEDRYRHLTHSGWTNFVARKLVPADETLQALQLPDMHLMLTGENHWQLSPEKPGVSADAIQQLIDNWKRANALFVRRYDGRSSDEMVTLEFMDNPQALTFMIIEHSPELILASPDRGLQYHLTGSMEKALLTLPQL